MAQLNITLNQDEILQLLLVDREEAFRKLLQRTLNDILKVESHEQLQEPLMSALTAAWTVATDFVPESLRHESEELRLRFRDTATYRSRL